METPRGRRHLASLASFTGAGPSPADKPARPTTPGWQTVSQTGGYDDSTVPAVHIGGLRHRSVDCGRCRSDPVIPLGQIIGTPGKWHPGSMLMTTTPRPAITPQLMIGVCIMAVGVLLTLDAAGLLSARNLLRYWPLALIAVGGVTAAQAQDRTRLMGGLTRSTTSSRRTTTCRSGPPGAVI